MREPPTYPRDQIEFERIFSTEKKCVAFLARVQWPNGFRCPRCGNTKSWVKTRARVVCTACRHETSLTANTLFSCTNLSLRLWFHALWWMTSQKNGISAAGFQSIMGIGSYRTAWAWLHKLRRAMSLREKTKLSGVVEVDETFIGGVRPGKAGRGALGKILVAVAAEVVRKGTGRIRLVVIPDAKAPTLTGFILDNVEKGTSIISDGLVSYYGITVYGYPHTASSARNAVPRAHKAMSLLKRWLLGTHQGRIEGKYLQRYLDEFVFRFNRRRSRNRGNLFKALLALCLAKRGTSTPRMIWEADKDNVDPEFFPRKSVVKKPQNT